MGLDTKSAIVILIDTEGNFILQDRDNKPGIIDPGEIALFGGTVEEGESFEQAAMRELMEELELNIDLEKLKYFKEFESQNGSRLVKIFVYENVESQGLATNEGKGVVILSPEALTNLPRLGKTAQAILSGYLKK